ncbi:MAG: DNA/RNA nuclease SfsA [candidate division WOR-3 bacterium]
MKLPKLFEAKVVKRERRFRLYVDLSGRVEIAYLANPGRLQEIIYPGARVFLSNKGINSYRKTQFEAVLGFADGITPVSLNASLANYLFLENIYKIFPQVKEIRREYTFRDSRFDFLLDGEILVEVKSCTLVKGGIGLFPDAPTMRGTKHLKTLLGWPGKKALVFVVQREDAVKVMPNYEMDKEFGTTMEKIFGELDYKVAFTVKISGNSIDFKEFVPVSL